MSPLGEIKIEGTELPIRDEDRWRRAFTWSECHNGVVNVAVRTDPGGEKQSAVTAKPKPARERHNAGREDMLAGRIKAAGKGHDRLTPRL
jgi:hypothetical protein